MLITQLAVGKAVDALKVVKQALDAGTHRRDQFDQRFGIVRGNGWMRQGRAQRDGVRRLSQRTGLSDSQTFLLDAVFATGQVLPIGRLTKNIEILAERW